MKIRKLLKKYHLTKLVKLIFLFRRTGRYLSYEDIIEELSIKKSGARGYLKELREDGLLEKKFLNYSKITDPRVKFKLNRNGSNFADKFINLALKCYELKILHFHNKVRKYADDKIVKDLSVIMNLFNEFGFNKTALEFSRLIRNFTKNVKKYFLYENRFDHSIKLIETATKND